jgi:acyl carrier protein
MSGPSMSEPTPALAHLATLAYSERRDALEALVVAEFRDSLQMTDDDDLPMDESFFDIGLTSLRLTELKERIEALVGRPISANALFNRPTVDSLMDHLTRDVVPELFDGVLQGR